MAPGQPARAHVEVRTSGRGPVTLRVELLQGERRLLLATREIPANRFAFWNPHAVRQAFDVELGGAAPGIEPGAATLRATAVSVPAWLWQPPPVTSELVARMPEWTSP